MPILFAWDAAKAESNLHDHGVRFDVAISVFLDPQVSLFDTTRPQDGEARTKAVGIIAGRLFTVVFTMRGDVCRVISARRANKKEIRSYGHR